MKIRFKLWVNGLECEAEADTKDLQSILPPEELNQKQAAAFMRINPRTLRRMNLPRNANGKYSLAALKQRME